MADFPQTPATRARANESSIWTRIVLPLLCMTVPWVLLTVAVVVLSVTGTWGELFKGLGLDSVLGKNNEMVLRRLTEPLQIRTSWDIFWVVLVIGLAAAGFLVSMFYLGYSAGKESRQGRYLGWWLMIIMLVVVGVLPGVTAILGYLLGSNARREGWTARPWTASLAALGCFFFLLCGAQFITVAILANGREGSGWAWLWLLIPTLFVAFGYTAWMYVRDGRAAGPLWAIFLGGLRGLVYLLLTLVFLLPAVQSYNPTSQSYEVLVLFDISDSMNTKEGVPDEKTSFDKLPSRQDKIIDFLDGDAAFIQRLQARNPVYCYRFGSQLDAAEFKEFKKQDLKDITKLSRAAWADWLKVDVNKILADVQDPAERDQKEKFYRDLIGSTSLGDSALTLYKSKPNALLQGVIVFSDGRNNQGSAQAFAELRKLAREAQVPIFTVVVGEDRQRVNIRITSVEAPTQTRPDDKFTISVDIDGEGLPDEETAVILEALSPSNIKFDLGPKPAKFKPGEPPHAQVEFEIDPKQPGMPPGVLKKNEANGQMELEEGQWTFMARVPRDKREAVSDKEAAALQKNAASGKLEHVSKKMAVQVVKRPLRVLLVAGALTRECLFVKNLFVREVDRRRMELSIYLQLARPEVVLDVPPERKLLHFPDRLVAEEEAVKPEDKYYNLSQYDLIIAFDPDWTNLTSNGERAVASVPESEKDDKRRELTLERLNLLKRWVDKQAGGLVLVAGPVNTYQLARAANKDVLDPLLTLFPVYLSDNRLEQLPGKRRPSTDPWRLHFRKAQAEMNFLKLDDEKADPLAGWNEFFGPGAKPQRGFYSYYPVKNFKKGATVVATFTDPRARMTEGELSEDDKEQPYLVTMTYGGGKVVYLGSGEMWRLRNYRESYYERFWAKLARYAGSGNLSRSNRRGLLIMSETFLARKPVIISGRVLGADLQPLPKDARPPKARITPPAGVKLQKTEFEMQPRESQSSEGWNGRFACEVRLPGSADPYQVELLLPSGESVDKREFFVEKDNPELNDVRPDYGQMYQLASGAKVVLTRMEDEKKKEKLTQLLKAPPNLSVLLNDKDQGDERDGDPHRLYFTLDTADIIPDCMITPPPKTGRHKAGLENLWDKGPTVTQQTAAFGLAVAMWVLGMLAISLGLTALLGLVTGRSVLIAVCVLGLLLIQTTVLWVLWWAAGIFGNLAIASGVAFLLFGVLTWLMRSSDKPVQFNVIWLGITLAALLLLVVPLLVLVLVQAGTKPIMIGYLLMVIVAFLSLEWLTRKLLKLA
jgi:hypothetical protein